MLAKICFYEIDANRNLNRTFMLNEIFITLQNEMLNEDVFISWYHLDDKNEQFFFCLKSIQIEESQQLNFCFYKNKNSISPTAFYRL